MLIPCLISITAGYPPVPSRQCLMNPFLRSLVKGHGFSQAEKIAK